MKTNCDCCGQEIKSNKRITTCYECVAILDASVYELPNDLALLYGTDADVSTVAIMCTGEEAAIAIDPHTSVGRAIRQLLS